MSFRIRSFRQGTPASPELPRHEYGASDTIHQTGTIDIQVDEATGEVIAVWFRCLALPFRVSTVRDRQVIQPDITIEKVTYVRTDGT